MSGALPTPTAGDTSWDVLARAAAQRDQQQDAAELRQLLCFLVDGSPYAVPVESVREIVRIRPITPIPRVTRHVRGVISLRGEILQVVDLRLRMGLPETEIQKASRILVVQAEDDRVAGVLVDAVQEVLRVSSDALAQAAGDGSGTVAALCARGDEFVSLIDLSRVLEFGDG